jgi:hypothetical protein
MQEQREAVSQQQDREERLMRIIANRARTGAAPLASSAFGLLAPFLLVPDSWAAAVADAMEWIVEDRIVAIATAANALSTLL